MIMTEEEKMINGKIYDPMDENLVFLRNKAHNLCREFNALTEGDKKRELLLDELVPHHSNVWLAGPVFFDYGKNTTFGKNCFANFNLYVLDCCPVTIGDDVFFGPNVSILTPMHPLLAEERKMYFDKEKGYVTDKEYAKPISIGDGTWIAGNVIINGGVTIGKRCVIGSGSVVTRDIPDDSLAVGNPARVIRKITKEDSIYLKKELF